MKFLPVGYDTETIRQMVEIATGSPTSAEDIKNLSRPTNLLGEAKIRPGFYSKGKSRRIITAMLRRRLAAQLGRVSPRLLDDSHSITCRTCGGVAVKWDGRWLCEEGHGGNTNE